jgi:ApeA N-terminal domain 1
METKTGKFSVSPSRVVAGELQVAGPGSCIVLRDDEFFYINDESNLCITGTLYDQTKITLIDCIQTSAMSQRRAERGSDSHSVTLFPHFIAQGPIHLEPDKPIIREISFTFEDVAILFYDFDAFGGAVDATALIGAVVKANEEKFGRKIRIGPRPEIAYFGGQSLIMEADTSIGQIRAEHRPSWPIGGPQGVRIDNQIWLTIIPEIPVTMNDAVDRLTSLLRFVAIAVGRTQCLPIFVVRAVTGDASQEVRVHWSDYPRRSGQVTDALRKPQPSDLPLDSIHRSKEFVTVLKAWLAVNRERLVARARIDDALSQQNHYTVDRLVGAANAFDHLPASAVPGRVDLTPEVTAAKTACQKIVRALPKSDERQTLLNDLGRVGKACLKQKVRHRARHITAAAGDKFPSLDFVCDQAVNCRNYFVHGSKFGFELTHPSPNQSFLTDTLEFVFAASEFIEAGWDIRRFLNAPTSMSHPFGSYRMHYEVNLRRFRASATPAIHDNP